MRPVTRELAIVAQDPSVLTHGRILMAKIRVPMERLAPGPRGSRVRRMRDPAARGK
jgi:hypothetical protein